MIETIRQTVTQHMLDYSDLSQLVLKYDNRSNKNKTAITSDKIHCRLNIRSTTISNVSIYPLKTRYSGLISLQLMTAKDAGTKRINEQIDKLINHFANKQLSNYLHTLEPQLIHADNDDYYQVNLIINYRTN